MNSPNLIKYPYDPTGSSPFNRVVGEILHLPRGTRERAYGLQGGPFYANSVVVKTVPNNVTLTLGDDYELLYLYQEATKATGQPIKAVVYVFNEEITGQVSVDYQVVGGEFSSNVSAIQALIETLQIDERTIIWDDILDQPVTFPPAPHLHHVNDLYGMEAFIDSVDRLTAAVLAMGEGGGISEQELQALLQRISTLEQSDANQSMAIAALAQSLQGFVNQTNQAMTALKTAIEKEVVIAAPTVLSIGRSHLFMGSHVGTTPAAATLEIGSVIHLSRSQIDIEPSVVVDDPQRDQIRYRGVVGTGFNYLTRNALKMTLVAPRLWEVSNDDD